MGKGWDRRGGVPAFLAARPFTPSPHPPTHYPTPRSVGDVMTYDPICVRTEMSVEDAANLLLRMKIRRLPVVDERGRLLGIISRGNIIRAALEHRKTIKSTM